MNEAINGSETNAQSGSAYAALVDFYKAFNQRNLSLMEKNWLQPGSAASLNTPQASMSNPLGGVKRGWNEIGSVYKNIFNGPAQIFVEFYDFNIYETEKMFCVVGKERGYFKTTELKIDLAIRTSRVFIDEQSRWQQIHHHGSIEQADLLASYQKAVLQQVHI